MKKALNRNGWIAQFSITAQIMVMLLWPAIVVAGPGAGTAGNGNPTVGSGNVTVQQRGNTTVINQTSDRATLLWDKFNIDVNKIVDIRMPNAKSAEIEKVMGVDPSSIMGRLISNGRVFIINPNGIVFGPKSQVDVAGLVATTLNASNVDLLNGHMTLAQQGTALGSIVNQGRIRVSDGGVVFLIAPNVENDGLIVANLGHIALAAGTNYQVDFAGDGMLTYSVKGSVINAMTGSTATNKGTLQARGGAVDMKAAVINQNGVIEAQSVQNHGGSVTLSGADPVTGPVQLGYTYNYGKVQNAIGTIFMTGKIIVSELNAVAAPGSVSITGQNITVSGSILAQGRNKAGGGSVRIASTASTVLTNSALIDASNTGIGGAGIVEVWSDTNTSFAGTIDANAIRGPGGNAEVSGHTLGFNGKVDLSSKHGTTGTLLLDPLILNIDENLAATFGTEDAALPTILEGTDAGTTQSVSVPSVAAALGAASVILEAEQTVQVINPGGANPTLSWATANSLTIRTTDSGLSGGGAGNGVINLTGLTLNPTGGGAINIAGATALVPVHNTDITTGVINATGASAVSIRSFQGNVTIGGTIDTLGSVGIRADVNGVGTGAVTINSAIGSAQVPSSLIVQAGAGINLNAGGASITTAGSQTFTGAVTLGATQTLASTAGGGTILFQTPGTIDGAFNLTLNANTGGGGNVTVNGAIGGTTTIGALIINANNITLNSIRVSGGSNPVMTITAATLTTLNGNITLVGDGAGANVTTFNGPVQISNTTNPLTIAGTIGNDDPITFNGPLNATVAGVGLIITNGFNVIFNGPVGNSAGGSVPLQDLSVSGGSAAGSIQLNNAAGVITTRNQTYTGPVTLGASQTLASTGGGGTVLFQTPGTINGAFDLTINANAGAGGNVTINGAVGGTTPVNSLTISANNISLNAVTTNGATAPAMTFTAAAAGATTLNGNLRAIDGPGNESINFNGPVLVNGARTITGAGNGDDSIIFSASSTIDGVTGAASLTVNNFIVFGAGLNTVTFGGQIGGTTPLSFLTVSATTINLNAAGGVTTTGGQTYTGAVRLGASQTLQSTGGGATILFNGAGTIDNTFNLVINANASGGGNVQINGAAGGNTPLNSIIINANNITLNAVTTNGNTPAGIVTATDAMVFNAGNGGVITLLGDLTAIDNAPNETISFTGPVVIAAPTVTINGAGAGDDPVVFSATSTINGDIAGRNLVVNNDANGTGDVITFGGRIGNTVPLATLTAVAGTINTNATGLTTIVTTGTIDLNGAVVLGNNQVWNTTAGGDIHVDNALAGTGTIDGGFSLTMQTTTAGAGSVTVDGSIGFNTNLNLLTINSRNNVTLQDVTTTGDIAISAQNQVTLNSDGAGNLGTMNATAAHISILANQDGVGAQGFTQNAGQILTTSADVSTATPAVQIIVNKVGAGNGTGNANLSPANNSIVATNGRVTIDVRNSVGGGGRILDNTGGLNDITATQAVLYSNGAINLQTTSGAGGMMTMEASANNATGSLSAGIAIVITNTGALTLQDIDLTRGTASQAVRVVNAGGINITAASPLTVADNVIAPGDISLTAASDFPGAVLDTLTVNDTNSAGTAGVLVQSTGGNVTLTSGGNMTIGANGGFVTSVIAANTLTTTVGTDPNEQPATLTVGNDDVLNGLNIVSNVFGEAFFGFAGSPATNSVTVNATQDIVFLATGGLIQTNPNTGTVTLFAGDFALGGQGRGGIVRQNHGTLLNPDGTGAVFDNNVIANTLNVTAGGSFVDVNGTGAAQTAIFRGQNAIELNTSVNFIHSAQVISQNGQTGNGDISIRNLNMLGFNGTGNAGPLTIGDNAAGSQFRTVSGNISVGATNGTLLVESPTTLIPGQGIRAGGGDINLSDVEYSFVTGLATNAQANGDIIRIGNDDVNTLRNVQDLSAVGQRISLFAAGSVLDGDGVNNMWDIGGHRMNMNAQSYMIRGLNGVGTAGQQIELFNSGGGAMTLAGAYNTTVYNILSKGSVLVSNLSVALGNDPEADALSSHVEVNAIATGLGIHEVVLGSLGRVSIEAANLADPFITVNADIVNGGTVLLQADETPAPTPGDDITVNARVTSTAANVLLHAGDNVTINAGGIVAGGGGTPAVDIVAGFNDNDGSGSITVNAGGLVGLDTANAVISPSIRMTTGNAPLISGTISLAATSVVVSNNGTMQFNAGSTVLETGANSLAEGTAAGITNNGNIRVTVNSGGGVGAGTNAILLRTATTGTMTIGSTVAPAAGNDGSGDITVANSGVGGGLTLASTTTTNGNLNVTANGPITQTAAVVINGNTVLSNGAFGTTLNNAANSFGGTVTFNDGGAAAGSVAVRGLGTIDFLQVGGGSMASLTLTAGTIIVDSAVNTVGAQTYNGAITLNVNGLTTAGGTVTLNGATTLGATPYAISTAGGNIIANGAIDGATDLTLNAGGGNVTVRDVGLTTSLNSLTVTGTTINLNGAGATTINNQTYNGNVALGAANRLTSTGAGTIAFNGNVNGLRDLFVQTVGGTATFGGGVGNAQSLNDLFVTAANINLNSALGVQTVFSQTYTGAVALSANQTLASTGGGSAILFQGPGTINGGNDNLTINATAGGGGNVTILGAVTNIASLSINANNISLNAVTSTGSNLALAMSFNAAVATTLNGDLLVPASGGFPPINFTGPVLIGAPAVTISEDAGGNGPINFSASSTINGTGLGNSLTIGGTSTSVTFGAAIGNVVPLQTITVLVPGTPTNLNGGSVTTTGGQTWNGPVTLGASTTLTAGGTIAFGQTINGAQSLTINDAGNAVNFTGIVGSGPSLTTLTISNASNVTFSAALNTTGSVTQTTGTGTTTFNGGNVGGSLSIANNAVTLNGGTLAVTGAASLTALNGTITDNGGAGILTVGGTSTLSATGNISLTNANNSFTGALSAVSNTGTISLRDNATGLAIGGVGLNAAGTITLTTAGGITENGASGVVTPSLSVTAVGAVSMNSASNSVGTLAASVTGLNNAFSFGDASSLTVGTVGAVAGVTTNGGNISLTAGGNLTITRAGAAAFEVTTGSVNNGTVSLISVTGSVGETAGGAGGDVRGNNLVVSGATGVSLGVPGVAPGFGTFRAGTNVANLAGNGGTGGFVLANQGNLQITTINGMIGVSTQNGPVTITASSTIDVNSPITAAGDITLSAIEDAEVPAAGSDDNVLICANVESTNGSVTLFAADTVDVNALITAAQTVNITANYGDDPVEPVAPGGIFFSPGGAIGGNVQDIILNSNGDITVGTLIALNTVTVNSFNGSINIGGSGIVIPAAFSCTGAPVSLANVEGYIQAGSRVTLRASNNINFNNPAAHEGTAINAGTIVTLDAGQKVPIAPTLPQITPNPLPFGAGAGAGIGAITHNTAAGVIDVTAQSVIATAATGGNGVNNAINFNGQFQNLTNAGGTGGGSAGNITISDNQDMIVGTVSSTGAVILTTTGAMIGQGGVTNVTATSLTANSGAGVTITTSLSGAGTLTGLVTGAGNITITNTSGNPITLTGTSTGSGNISVTNNGNIFVDSTTALGGTVNLNATAGAINDADGAVGTDITAASILLQGTLGVGSAGAPIRVSSGNVNSTVTIAGTFSTGGFFVTEQGSRGLTVGTVSGVAGVTDTSLGSAEAITLVANSPLEVASNITGAGTITLTASGSGGADDLTIDPAVTVSTTGAFVFSAGRNVNVFGFAQGGASSSITSGTNGAATGGSVVDAANGISHVTLTAGTLTVNALGDNGNLGINVETTVPTAALTVTGAISGGINVANSANGSTFTVNTATTATTTGNGTINLSNTGTAMTVTTATTAASNGQGNITVASNGGNLTIGTLRANAVGSNNTTTVASAGNVTSNGAATNVVSTNLVANSATGVGPLNTTVSNLVGNGGAGNFAVTNTGAGLLTVGGGISATKGITAGGTITLTNDNSIHVTENIVAAGAVAITGGGEANNDNGFLVDVDTRVQSTGSSVTITGNNDADNFVINGLVQAATSVTMTNNVGFDQDESITTGPNGLVQGTSLSATAGNGISLTTLVNTITLANTTDASIAGNITITNLSGNLAVTNVSSANGNVILHAIDGTMTIANGPNGVSVGNAANTILLETSAGNLNVSGGIVLGSVGVAGATPSLVEVDSANTITDNNGDGNAFVGGVPGGGVVNIRATNLILNAPGGVGTAGEQIDTQVTTVAGTLDQGGFFLHNVGALTVGTVTSVGGSNEQGIVDTNLTNDVGAGAPVTISTESPLTIANNIITTGAVTLIAGMAPGAVDNQLVPVDSLTINTGVTVQSTQSTVNLQAADNILVSAGSFVKAFGAVTITAGTGADSDVDTDFGNVTILGTVQGGLGGAPNIITVNAVGNIILGVFVGNGGSFNTTMGSILNGIPGQVNFFGNGTWVFNAPHGTLGTDTNPVGFLLDGQSMVIANVGGAVDRVSVNAFGKVGNSGRIFANVLPPGLILLNDQVDGGGNVNTFHEMTSDLNIRIVAEPGVFSWEMYYLNADIYHPMTLWRWETNAK